MAVAMGEDVQNLPEKEKAFAFIDELKKLIRNAGLEKNTLAALGVRKEDFPRLAENAYYTMGDLFDETPVKMEKSDVVEIFERAYSQNDL